MHAGFRPLGGLAERCLGGFEQVGVFWLSLQLLHHIRFKRIVFPEKVMHPGGDFLQQAHFFLHAVNGGGCHGFIANDQPCGCQERQAGIQQCLGTECTQELRIEPLALLQIKPRIGAVDVGRVEELGEFLASQHLFVSPWCPAEHGQVIEHRIRQEALVDVAVLDRAARVAFAHLGAVGVQDEWNVGISGRCGPQGVEEVNVLPGVREVILSAKDVRHAHLDVIHDIDEMENVAAIWATNRHVGFLRRGEGHIATNEIVHGDGGAAELETHGSVFFRINAACGLQLGQVSIVDRLALTLKVGAVRAAHLWTFIPVQAQPAQALHDAALRFFGIACAVRILDPQDESAAGLTRKKPVEQSRAATADMQIASGRGSKTNTRSHEKM